MMPDAQDLVNFVQSKMPELQAAWRSSIEMGRQARRDGEPRLHRQRHRTLFFRGWDQEDERIKKEAP